MKEVFVKYIDKSNIETEINAIGFDKSYLHHAVEKNTFKTIKLFNLKPQQATIIKQTALSLGFDACAHRGVLDCSVEYSDCILTGSLIQFKNLFEKLQKQPFKLKEISKNILSIIEYKIEPLKIRNTVFDWSRPYLMGIVNVTPDSFSDGGEYWLAKDAISHAQQLIKDGADIIDIGAESTRPNHIPITVEEEISRIKNVIQEIRNINKEIIISIDTRNTRTAEMAINSGADIVNDISFAQHDKNMIDFINQNNIPYILTHNQNTDKNIDEVYYQLLTKKKVISAPTIIDIGIGFDKNEELNYELIKRIEEFKSLNCPILVGHSRKSFLSNRLNLTTNKEKDFVTGIMSACLIKSGVNILRVHEIKQHKLALDAIRPITTH